MCYPLPPNCVVVTNKWYDINYLNVLDNTMCYGWFYSSKFHICSLWPPQQCWNAPLLPAGKLVSFLSRGPWRDPEEKQSLVSCILFPGKLLSALWPAACRTFPWYLPQHPRRWFPSASPVNFSANHWAPAMPYPDRCRSQSFRAGDHFQII